MKVQSDSFEKTQLYFPDLIKKPIKNRFTELRRDNNDVVRLHGTQNSGRKRISLPRELTRETKGNDGTEGKYNQHAADNSWQRKRWSGGRSNENVSRVIPCEIPRWIRELCRTPEDIGDIDYSRQTARVNRLNSARRGRTRRSYLRQVRATLSSKPLDTRIRCGYRYSS